MLTGGCFCGHVRYEISGAPFDQTNCHCSMCRRTSGAAFLTWFSVKCSEFRIVSGIPVRFRSSAVATRSFCPRCGTQLTFEMAREPDDIAITTCSLDDPEAVPPRDHIWTASRLSWMRVADGLPEFRQERADG